MNYAKIAEGLRMIADALEETPAKAPAKPTARSSSKAPPKDEDDRAFDEDPPVEESSKPVMKEVTLKDLQSAARKLINANRRPDMVEVLESFEAKNLSSIPEDKWDEAHEKLLAAAE